MSQEVEEQLQAQVAELKDRIEQLEAAYKDVAYEFTNNLQKRIEDIRIEVMATLDKVAGHFDVETARKVAETTAQLNQVVENAKQSLTHDTVVASLAEHKQQLLGAFIDPSTGRLRHR